MEKYFDTLPATFSPSIFIYLDHNPLPFMGIFVSIATEDDVIAGCVLSQKHRPGVNSGSED